MYFYKYQDEKYQVSQSCVLLQFFFCSVFITESPWFVTFVNLFFLFKCLFLNAFKGMKAARYQLSKSG